MNQNLNSTDSKNVSKECDCFICTLQWNVKNLHYFPSSKETHRIKPFSCSLFRASIKLHLLLATTFRSGACNLYCLLLSQLANTLKWPKLCNLSNVQRQKGIVEMLIFVKLGLWGNFWPIILICCPGLWPTIIEGKIWWCAY